MKKSIRGGLRVLLIFSALVVGMGLAGMRSEVVAQDLPDLVPMGLDQWLVTTRLGGPTLEFGILTANIGGQDFERPFDPDTGQRLLRQIYEYALFIDQDGEWVEVDRRRKNTICTIDDTRRGNVFPCIQDHGPVYTCGGVQGISRGWADDYFRGLTGQWVFIGDNTGRMKLQTILDPDGDLQRMDIPDSGRDGNPDNNFADVIFTYTEGTSIELEKIILYFDPDGVCPVKK